MTAHRRLDPLYQEGYRAGHERGQDRIAALELERDSLRNLLVTCRIRCERAEKQLAKHYRLKGNYSRG
jgi:hypothetical protein